jgi:hypothetical protein
VLHTVYIAEAASLALFGVMQSSCPVDCNVTFLTVQASSTLHTAAGADAAEFKETVEYGAIVSHIELGLLALEIVHVLGTDLLQEVDVLVGVKLGHLESGGWLRSVYLHLLVHAVIHDQAMGETYSVRLHGMASDVGEVANIGIVEVGDLLGTRCAEGDAIAIGNIDRGGMRHGSGDVLPVGWC